MSVDSTYLSLADGSESLSQADVETAVEYAFGHRKVSIQEFLSNYSLPTTGKKDELREAVVKGIKDGDIPREDIIAFLDSLEGWGNQHIYLFKSSDKLMKQWKVESNVKQILDEAEVGELLNSRRPLVLPDEPTLSSIEWTKKRVRFVWVDKREWQDRMEEEDDESEDGQIIYKAYRQQVTRGITSFDWNLVSGEAALMIQTLPRGENYDEIRQVYEDELSAFFDFSDFARRRITKAIKKLEASKEALNRKIELATRTGAIAAYTSKGRKTDAYADEDIKKSRTALGQRTTSRAGNFYFQPSKNGLTRTIHVKLYAADQRVGIFGECTEQEVGHVLSRIRQHIK